MPRGELVDTNPPVMSNSFGQSTVEIRQTNADGTQTVRVTNDDPEAERQFDELFAQVEEMANDPNASTVNVEWNNGEETVTTSGSVTPEARKKLDEIMAGFNQRVTDARSQVQTSAPSANSSPSVRVPVALGVVFLMNHLFFCVPGIVLYISNRKLNPSYAKKVLILTVFQIVLSALVLILYKSGVILSRLKF